MSEEVTRNTFGPSGDDVPEMTTPPRLDDRTADALFSGRIPAAREDLADVAALAESLGAAASALPTPAPNAALAALLEGGLSPHEGDLAAPAARGTRPSNRRTKKMLLETLIAKLAGISLLAKTGVAAAAVTASATGAGLTGHLPAQVQEPFDRAFGVEAPDDDEDATTSDDEIATPEDESEESTEVVLEGSEDEATGEDDAADVTDEDTPATDEDAGRPEVPGAEGRANAAENAGENGAHGRATAEDAATRGREFGQERAAEAKERRPDAPSDDEETDEASEEASNQRSETGEQASEKGRERAAEARGGSGDDESDETSEESGDDATGAGADKPPAGRP